MTAILFYTLCALLYHHVGLVAILSASAIYAVIEWRQDEREKETP